MNFMSQEAKASILDSSVAGFLLRIQVNQGSIIPSRFWTEEYQPRPERPIRNRPMGVTVIEVQEISLEKLINDLAKHNFVLVDMTGTRMPAGTKPFGRVDFFFKREGSPEAIEYAREEYHPLLRQLTDTALWGVTVTRNKNIDGIEGREGFFLKIGGRTPFNYPNGTPITMRRKDEKGRPTGEPQPLRPEKFLRVRAGQILID